MPARMTASLVNDALLMATFKRGRQPVCWCIATVGTRFASRRSCQQGFVCGMSRKGNCWDNVPAESFFHTLTELCHYQPYTREQAKQTIFEYIEVFHNCQRRHSTIGYLSSVQFEQEHRKAA